MSDDKIKVHSSAKKIISTILKRRAGINHPKEKVKVDSNIRVINPSSEKTSTAKSKNKVKRYRVVYCDAKVNDKDDEKKYEITNLPQQFVFQVADLAKNEIIFAVQRKRVDFPKNAYANNNGTDWIILNPAKSLILSIKYNMHLFKNGTDESVSERKKQIWEKVCSQVRSVRCGGKDDKIPEKFITSTTLAYKNKLLPRVFKRDLGEAPRESSHSKSKSSTTGRKQKPSSKKMYDDDNSEQSNSDSDSDDGFEDFLGGSDNGEFTLAENPTNAKDFSENHKKLSSAGKNQQRQSKKKTSSSSGSTSSNSTTSITNNNNGNKSKVFKKKEFQDINVNFLKTCLPTLSKAFGDKIPKVEEFFGVDENQVENDYDFFQELTKTKFPAQMTNISIQSANSNIDKNKTLKAPANVRKEVCGDREIDFEYWCSLLVYKSKLAPQSKTAKFLNFMSKTIAGKYKDSEFFHVLNNETSYGDFGEGDGLKLFAGYLVLAKRVIELEQIKNADRRENDGEIVKRVLESFKKKLDIGDKKLQEHVEKLIASYNQIRDEYAKVVDSANQMAKNHTQTIISVTNKAESKNAKLLEKISALEKTKTTLVSDINDLREKQSKHDQDMREQELRLKKERDTKLAELKEKFKQGFDKAVSAKVKEETGPLMKKLKEYQEMYELSQGSQQYTSLLDDKDSVQNLPDNLSDLSSDDDDDQSTQELMNDDDTKTSSTSSSSSNTTTSEYDKNASKGKKRKSTATTKSTVSQNKLPKRHQKIIDGEKNKNPQDSLSDSLNQLETTNDSPSKKQKTKHSSPSSSPLQQKTTTDDNNGDTTDEDDYGFF